MILWQSVDTIPTHGITILIKTETGIVSAWFDKSEYEWVCYDDKFTISDGENIKAWAPI